MERTIYDIMTDDLRKIEEFNDACETIAKTQYVLVQKKIAGLLQIIATSKLLYALFDDLLRDFDYKNTAKACITAGGRGIELPKDPKTSAALIFCILLDIDKSVIELKDFLEFFTEEDDDDINAAYERFLQNIILMFRDCVLFLIEAIVTEINSAKRQSEKVEEQPESEPDFHAIETVMSAFASNIKDEKISPTVKDYLIVLCGDIASAVNKNEIKRAKNIRALLVSRLKTHIPELAKELERLDIEDYLPASPPSKKKK